MPFDRIPHYVGSIKGSYHAENKEGEAMTADMRIIHSLTVPMVNSAYHHSLCVYVRFSKITKELLNKKPGPSPANFTISNKAGPGPVLENKYFRKNQ